MQGIIGKKVGMTSIYSVDGKNIPCTVIEGWSLRSNTITYFRKRRFTEAVQLAL